MGGRRLGLGIWDGGVECGASFSSCFVFCQCQLLLEQLNPLLLLLLSVFLFSIAFLALEFGMMARFDEEDYDDTS
jgi:hypothetical protein